MRRSALLVGLLVALLAGGVFLLISDDPAPQPRFCYADALIGRTGETFGRGGKGCKFVDEDGNTLDTLRNGDPLCYDDAMAVDPECDG